MRFLGARRASPEQKTLIINDNGYCLWAMPVFDWFRPTFYIGLTIPTTAIRRGATRIAIISRCVVLGEARFAPTVALLARIRNATLFFALKVQYNLAQGSALGYDTTRPMRPVGVAHGSLMFCMMPPNVLHWANDTHRRLWRGSMTACQGAPLHVSCFAHYCLYFSS